MFTDTKAWTTKAWCEKKFKTGVVINNEHETVETGEMINNEHETVKTDEVMNNKHETVNHKVYVQPPTSNTLYHRQATKSTNTI